MIFSRLCTLFLIAVCAGFADEHESTQMKLAEPVIVELDEMNVVGIQILFSLDCNLIPVLWERFATRMQEIENVSQKDVALEISYDVQGKAEEETFFVLVGMIVEDVTEIPEGMTYKHIPAHKYAMFTHYGPISQIYDTYDRIFNEILPRSAYEFDEKACEIEWYDGRFKKDSPDSEYDIYVPVRQRP
jgi:AraC family transcriptional regulator